MRYLLLWAQNEVVGLSCEIHEMQYREEEERAGRYKRSPAEILIHQVSPLVRFWKGCPRKSLALPAE
jgi:hypothetical protein